MRQAVQAFIIGGALFSATACGTASNPAPGEAGAGIGSAAAVSGAAAPAGAGSAVRSSCEALGQVYSKNMAPFAEALTKLAGARGSGNGKKEKEQVRQTLVTFAAAISSATQSSTDPEIKRDGQRAAERIKKEAADAKLFDKVKTTEDVNTAVGSTLKEWLSPVDMHCS